MRVGTVACTVVHWRADGAAAARRRAARDVTRRRASRTRPRIERHVPLAAGRPLRPTDTHFFIFPPNVDPWHPNFNRKARPKRYAEGETRARPVHTARHTVRFNRIQNGRTERSPELCASPPLTAQFWSRSVCASLYKCYASLGRWLREGASVTTSNIVGAVNLGAHVTHSRTATNVSTFIRIRCGGVKSIGARSSIFTTIH